MTKVAFRRKGLALYPADDATMEWLEGVQQNIDIVGDLRVPRNAKNHRHMFAILNEAAKNIDGFVGVDDLLEYLKLQAGMYKVRSYHKSVDHIRILRTAWRKLANGEFNGAEGCILWIVDAFKEKRFQKDVEVITYESLNFESMDEVRFKRVKERFLWILTDKFGFEPNDLEERAMQQLAAYGAPDRRERRERSTAE